MHTILFLILAIGLPQIRIEAPGGGITVRTVKEKKTPYVLITKDEPAKFSVEGPLYIRVFTRLLYMKGDKEMRTYKILVQEDEKTEKIYTKTTEPSSKSFYDSAHVGKWRVIPIQVPPGKHSYKLSIFESAYPVAIRLVPGRPPNWTSLVPEETLEEINAVENEKIVRYYLLPTDSFAIIKITGPVIFKVEARSIFRGGMGNVDHFTIKLSENGRTLKSEDMSVYPSDIVSWKEHKEWIPSQKVSMTLSLAKGDHRIKVQVTGSLSPMMALRFLKEVIKGG